VRHQPGRCLLSSAPGASSAEARGSIRFWPSCGSAHRELQAPRMWSEELGWVSSRVLPSVARSRVWPQRHGWEPAWKASIAPAPSVPCGGGKILYFLPTDFCRSCKHGAGNAQDTLPRPDLGLWSGHGREVLVPIK